MSAGRDTRRARPVAVLLAGALLVAQGWLVVHAVRGTTISHRVLRLEAVTVPLYLVAVLLLAVSRLPARRAVVLVVLGGAALQVCGIVGAPVSSDDDYRYIWDAKVQLSGTDPYRYPPSAPELTPLRDGFLFPPAGRACPNPFPGGCTVINRPTGRTIYPPVAQLAFDAVHVLSFGGRGHHVPLQVAAVLGAIAISLLIARRAPPWQVSLWAWCPVTVVEAGNNAHIDWLGVLFAVLALQECARRRPGWAGVLVGAAAAVKLYPALVGAAMLRRRPVLVVTGAVGVFLLSYVPHVLAVGGKVVGYLPKYLQEEDYSSGGRFLLFHGFWSAGTTQRVVVALLLVVAVAVVLRSDPDRPERGAAVLAATAFALVSPDQSWYYLLLLALVAMTGWVELLPFVLAGSVVYLHNADFGLDVPLSATWFRYASGLFVVGVAARVVVRRSRSTRPA